MAEIKFRQAKRADIEDMKKWGRHEDPRFYHYSFPYKEATDLTLWYKSKQRIFKRLYGIFLDDYMVGYMTLKNIRYFRKIAELGIAVDPNYLNQRIGRKGIHEYLDYCFNYLGFQRIYLKTAYFNERAIKVYKSEGFKQFKEKTENFEEQTYSEEIIKAYPDQFTMKNGKIQTKYLYFEIFRENFEY